MKREIREEDIYVEDNTIGYIRIVQQEWQDPKFRQAIILNKKYLKQLIEILEEFT